MEQETSGRQVPAVNRHATSRPAINDCYAFIEISQRLIVKGSFPSGIVFID